MRCVTTAWAETPMTSTSTLRHPQSTSCGSVWPKPKSRARLTFERARPGDRSTSPLRDRPAVGWARRVAGVLAARPPAAGVRRDLVATGTRHLRGPRAGFPLARGLDPEQGDRTGKGLVGCGSP